MVNMTEIVMLAVTVDTWGRIATRNVFLIAYTMYVANSMLHVHSGVQMGTMELLVLVSSAPIE